MHSAAYMRVAPSGRRTRVLSAAYSFYKSLSCVDARVDVGAAEGNRIINDEMAEQLLDIKIICRRCE